MARTKTPFIPQMEAVECGAACLTMVLASHGHWAHLSEVREACAVSRDGVNAMNIVRAAKGYGLKAKARRLEPADLSAVITPAILHWEFNHFVVLERYTPQEIFLLDPGMGPRVVSPSDFDGSFTGICLEFEPTEQLKPRKPELAALRHYLDLLGGAWPAVALLTAGSLALNALALALPLGTKVVTDHVLGQGHASWLGVTALGLAAALGAEAMLASLRGATQLALRQRLDTSIAVRFVAHLVRLPLGFLLQRHSADLMARVQTGRVLRDLLTGQSVSAVVDGLLVAGSLVLMCHYDIRVGILVLTLGAASVALTLRAREPQARRLQERQIREIREQVQLLQTLQGIVTLKSLGSERVSYERWRNLHVNALNAGAREAALGDLVTAALGALRTAAPLAVLGLGGQAVLQGRMSLGTLLALQMLQTSFLASLSALLVTGLRLEILPLLAQRLDDVLLAPDEPSGSEPAPRLRGEIEFVGVTARYGPTSPQALREASFHIAPGQKVALVGPSGCGKSTAARLLLGLFRPTEGKILLDGHDLSQLELSSVRNQIGVVLQETAIFDGTVRDNLSLNSPNAPLEEIVNAARAAQIHDDILALPRGYDTPLSGASPVLSGGQLQRLALARAILHRPAILVLDEATSALDAMTESAIEHHLSLRTCTRVVIAHRLSTVRDADQIFVLKDGVIVERGRHAALLADGGLYAELIRSGEKSEEKREPTPISVARIGQAVVERLGRFPVFEQLALAERERVAAALKVRTFRPGEKLLEQDQAPSGVLLVHSGAVAVRIDEPGLPPWTVAELKAPQVFGEFGLLDGSPSSAQLVALEACHAELLPLAFVEELRSKGDSLASRLSMAFGSLVARRLEETLARVEELLASGIDAEPPPATSTRGRTARATALADTPLGALLTPAELAEIVRTGELRTISRGQALLPTDGPEIAVAVVLEGVVTGRRGSAIEQVYGVGSTVAAARLFGVEPAETLVGSTEVSFFVVRREDIDGLVQSGNAAAAKLVQHCARSVAHASRLANGRLRELVAIRDNELDQARRERAEAIRMAQEEEQGLVASEWQPFWQSSKLPEARGATIALSGPTCLSAALTYYKRPVSPQVVAEACASPGGEVTPAAIAAGARIFHLDLRRIDAQSSDLAAAEVPLLVRKKDGGYVLLRPLRSGRAWVMDPSRGTSHLSASELAAFFPGSAYEIHEDRDDLLGSGAPFGDRVASFAQRHWRDLSNLGATALVLQSAAMGSSVLAGLLVGEALPAHSADWLRVGLVALSATWIAQNLATWARARLLSRLRALFDRDAVEQMLSHVLKLPIPFFEAHPPSDLLQRFQSFAQMRDVLSNQALAVVLDGSTLALALGPLLAFSPLLFSFVAAATAAHILAGLLAWPRLRDASLDEIRHGVAQQGRLMECLQGLVTLRLTGDHSLGVRRWAVPFLGEVAASVRQERILLAVVSSLRLTRQAALVAALCVGASQVLGGQLTLGSLLAAIGLSSAFLEALGGLTLQLVGLSRTTVHWRNLGATFRERQEQGGESLAPPGQIQGHITLENVSFRYNGEGPLILDRISLDIPRGAKVALVGRSGSGKSTLGKLLMGFYLPDSGRVLYDGRDIAHLELPKLRQQLGVVLQSTFLFGASIRENLSRGSDAIRLEDIQAAAFLAAIDQEIAALPMQYDTLLTEGGNTFSGGQRQRLAIARAVASRPAVLLLDEATSALDNKSQAAVEKRLSTLGCTRLVIAHRLSTVIDADLVVVIDQGRVVESGRHEELLKRGGFYRDLVKAQLG